MNKNSLLFFLPAVDFNETEFLVLRRNLKNSGFKIFISSDSVNLCKGNSGLKVKADLNLYNINSRNFAAFVLIGGSGARIYKDNILLKNAVAKFNTENKLIAAICSAPIILAKKGILKSRNATCFPGDKMELISYGVDFIDEDVVVSGNIITARDDQSSLKLAETIINLLKASN